MSLIELLGRTFEGYKPVEVVATGDDEVLFVGERVRDGGRVWIRTGRRLEDDALRARLSERYEAEKVAARRLASVAQILSVREIIHIDGAPALVTDIPRGRPLSDIHSESRVATPLKELLPWFRTLLTAMEAAHAEDTAHGALQSRAVYLDKRGRVTICGIAAADGDAAMRRTDVTSLARLLYHASTGKPPRRGFPDTGMPRSPDEIVPGYPATLARFLCRRLSDDADDSVQDAGVFRRSIDALSVDPEFRKAAGQGDPAETGGAGVIIERVSAERRWRRLAWLSLVATLLVAASVTVTFLVMEVRVDEARRTAMEARPLVAGGGESVMVRAASDPRLAVWECLHSPFLTGDAQGVDAGAAGMTPRHAAECMRLSPTIKRDELRHEAARLVALLEAQPISTDLEQAADRSYGRLFDAGPDSVAEYVAYRLQHDMPTTAIDDWIQTHLADPSVATLRTLAGRQDEVAVWARGILQRGGKQ